jgi:hypothetical protein
VKLIQCPTTRPPHILNAIIFATDSPANAGKSNQANRRWKRVDKLRGSCLCGAIQYEVPDNLLYAAYCHCSECRRFSGSAFSALGGLPREQLQINSGQDRIKYFRKTEASNMAFCETCGSSLFTEKPLKGLIHLRLGTLMDSPSLIPQAHVLVGSKAPWFQITDKLPQFEGLPPTVPDST